VDVIVVDVTDVCLWMCAYAVGFDICVYCLKQVEGLFTGWNQCLALHAAAVAVKTLLGVGIIFANGFSCMYSLCAGQSSLAQVICEYQMHVDDTWVSRA
jgi:hypothetical protein